MKNLKKKINGLAISLSLMAMDLKTKTTEKLSEEDGDTNFLSIIIILAIVLVVAAVFIMFKDQIIGAVQSAWNSFAESFNGQKDKDNISLDPIGG